MSRLFIAAWLMLGIAGAQAQTTTIPCRPDKISNSSGLIIALSSGQNFRAYPGSQGTLSGWLPLDKVTVCGIGGSAVSITNSSRKYQSVKAVRIFRSNSAGSI